MAQERSVAIQRNQHHIAHSSSASDSSARLSGVVDDQDNPAPGWLAVRSGGFVSVFMPDLFS
jgi:hypothetical protein